MTELSNELARELWTKHGGKQHGPHTETMYMPEANFAAFVDELLERRTSQPVAWPQRADGGWSPMETAPVGEPTEDAGCRGTSEWFFGRVAQEFRRAGAAPFVVIRRRSWPQEDSWMDNGETYYVPRYFDAWRPLFSSPPTQGEPVAMKGLEWAESNEGYAKGQWFANSIFGEYCTYIHIPSGRAWLQGPQLGEFFDTIAVAKAAAQADYEQRIRSALSPAPSLAVSDAAMLAGCRAISPGLFGRGFDPLPGDGPATKARMESDKLTVRKVLTAALGARHE